MLTRTASVVTTLADDALLFYAMTARETLGRPFSYDVTLLSTDENVDLSALLGQPLGVRLELADGSVREFNGIVTHFSISGALGRYVKYRASVRPWLWLLSQRKNSRIFQNKTVPDVLKQLFREHGFSDFSESLSDPQYRSWEFLVQYRESDLNFVSRLMEQEGIYYFFRHAEGRHTLVLADSYSAHEAAPGYESVPYYPPQQGERREADFVSSWSATRQIRPGAFAAADFDFRKPATLITSQLKKPHDHEAAEYEVFEYPGEFSDKPQADAQTKIRLEELQANYEFVQGNSNARGLSVGNLFTLTDHPRDDQNKEYLLVDVTYELIVSGYESGTTEANPPDLSLSFMAIDSHKPYRAPRTTRKPRVEGPQTAIVVGESGQEIWTDELGRVKVQFHWDRVGKYDENSSCFVRVAQVWAGSGFGGIHLPRIGQEVIVEFLEGDPDRPIITGRVYNQDNLPPYELPANSSRSGIKSRSTKGGSADNFNEIRFEDKLGQEQLYVQAEKDHTVLVKNNQNTTVQKSRSASVGGSDSVSVGGNRSLSVHGNLSVSVDGSGGGPPQSSHTVTGKHHLHASDAIDVDAPTYIKLECAGSSLTLTPSSITLSAGGGAAVVLDANFFAVAAGKSQLLLDQNACAESSAGSKLLLDGNVLAQSSAQAQLVLDANASLSAADVLLDGLKVAATGKTEASLTVGGNSVKVSPAGADVAGALVNVNGTGLVSIGGPMIKVG